MKYFFYSLCFLLSGCIGRQVSKASEVVTEPRRFLGVPIPFTRKPIEAEPTWLEIMNEQMAMFQWTSIACIIIGFIIAKLDLFPRTGLGVGLIGLGVLLSIWGLVAPKFVGVIALVATILFVVGVCYAIFCWATNRKIKLPQIGNEKAPS